MPDSKNYDSAKSLAQHGDTSFDVSTITFGILALVDAVNEQTRTLRDLEMAVRYQAGLELRKDVTRDT